MPTRDYASTRVRNEQNAILINVGGNRALERSLRNLSRAGDDRANPMYNDLRSAARQSSKILRQGIRKLTPEGNYKKRRPGQRRVNKTANTRAVQRGKYAGRQQPGGLLKKSVRSRTGRRGGALITVGDDAAYYIHAVVAGHDLPNGGEAMPNDFIWRARDEYLPKARRLYDSTIRRVARDYNRIYGNTQYRGLSRAQRQSIQGL